MAKRALLCLAHDFSFCSVSRILAIEEALIEGGHECAIVANHSHIDRLPQRPGMLFASPSIDMELLALCPYALSSCTDYFAAIGFDNFEDIESTYSSIVDAIERFRPDVMVTDFCAIGSIAACAYQVPLIATLRWTYHAMHPENQSNQHPRAGAALDAFNRLLSKLHLEETQNPAELIYRGSAKLIVPSIPILEIGIVDSPDVQWVGPLISKRLENNENTGGWTARKGDEKRLYVYLDPAVLNIPEQCELLCKAFRDSNWNIRVSVPREFGARFEKEGKAQNCIVQPPGRRMIELADIYITHCGSNSTQMAILNLTPVIAVPGDSMERQFNAYVLEQLGLARVLRLNDTRCNPQMMREWCESALSLTPTQNAVRWSTYIQNCKGASALPDILAHIGGLK